MRWREDIRKLQLLARDPLPLSIFSVEFIVMGSTFGILGSDEHKNFLVYVFNPASPEYRRQQVLSPHRPSSLVQCGGGGEV